MEKKEKMKFEKALEIFKYQKFLCVLIKFPKWDKDRSKK